MARSSLSRSDGEGDRPKGGGGEHRNAAAVPDHPPRKRLRREMTLPEVLVWQRLRTSPMELKFRRQHPVGAYVLDFYCPAASTGIEIDGMAHDMGDRPLRDCERDAWLLSRGIRMIRVPAKDVLRDVDSLVDAIVRVCLERC